MTTFNKYLGVILLAVAIGIVFLFGTHKNSPSIPAQTAVQTIKSDQDIVNALVKNFYGALEAQDGKLLFSYFTPPSTEKEKADFSWLTGADLGEKPEYRVFMRTKISNPKIDATEKINDTIFQVKVTDQVQGFSNAGEIVGWSSPQPRYVVLTIVKVDNKWLVDKFTNPSNSSNAGNAGSPKYNGFGQ